jgi:hypothetical protein
LHVGLLGPEGVGELHKNFLVGVADIVVLFGLLADLELETTGLKGREFLYTFGRLLRNVRLVWIM